MKKQNLMQEFESLKIEKASSLYGGQCGDGDTICEISCNYPTAPDGKTDTKTDRIVDDKENYCPADKTRVELPYIPPIRP